MTTLFSTWDTGFNITRLIFAILTDYKPRLTLVCYNCTREVDGTRVE